MGIVAAILIAIVIWHVLGHWRSYIKPERIEKNLRFFWWYGNGATIAEGTQYLEDGVTLKSFDAVVDAMKERKTCAAAWTWPLRISSASRGSWSEQSKKWECSPLKPATRRHSMTNPCTPDIEFVQCPSP